MDREKVIKGLECHQIDKDHRINCSDCPYHCDEFMNGLNELHNDALVLIKKQEPIKPLAQEDDSYECSCGAIIGWDELDASGIVATHFNYCPFCGRKVKWE